MARGQAQHLITLVRPLVWGVLLCAPYVALAIWLGKHESARSVAALLAAMLLTWLLVAALTVTWRRFALWQLPLFLLSVAFAGYTLTYQTPPGYLIATVLETSSLDEYLGFFTIWSGQRLLLGVLLGVGLYLWGARGVAALRISNPANRRQRWAIIAATTVSALFSATQADAMIDGFAADPVVGGALFLVGPVMEVRAALDGKDIQKVPYGASRVAGSEIHVLVIGESERRDSWSLYGYARPTTPALDAMRDELIVLKHAVADANLTVNAVPMLLTGLPATQYSLSAVHGNIVDLAHEAGYATTWLVNQDYHISTMVGVVADEMVFPDSLHQLDFDHSTLDGELLPALSRVLARKDTGARFIGLHVMGSHWDYDKRYPPAFRRFGIDPHVNFIALLAPKQDQQVVDAYDNSVRYCDWFLQQIIEQVRAAGLPATVTYISDHGENIYNLDGAAGHGGPLYRPHEFDVPAFVWTNAAYRAAHPEKVAAMRANVDKQIRTHDVFFTEADLMGIRWPGAAATRSFASRSFKADDALPVMAGANLVAAGGAR
jgi:glucan phosphoethanolaminetransferase (alkaline phosphatase superfamily)